MIDATEIDDLIQLLAKLHDIDAVKLNHPISLYMEPEEQKVFSELNARHVKTVGDFLVWTAYYVPYQQFDAKVLNVLSFSKILYQIKTL